MLGLSLAALMIFGSALAQPVAQAAAQEPLSVTLTLQRVAKGPQGEEILSAADKVKPGDLLEYRAVYTNKGERPLDNVFATVPVPASMEYQPRTATPAGAQAATGNGDFGPEPLMRKVQKPDGTDALEAVPYADYRALRWQIGSLQPKQSVSVTARVRVSATAEPAARAGEGS
jgi:uncharacterized repeat protein (TIGR01451 family)